MYGQTPEVKKCEDCPLANMLETAIQLNRQVKKMKLREMYTELLQVPHLN